MNYLSFVYTKHAKQRISERRIAINALENCVRLPDTLRHSFGGRCVARKRWKKRRIEVVYKKMQGRMVIITAYWVEE
jgi:hypothetical protein